MSKVILTLCPNPALDKVARVPRVVQGEVHKLHDVLVSAGGKGINVARAVYQLGGQTLASAPLGGSTGQLIVRRLEQAGIPGAFHWIEGESRVCLSLATDDGEATDINEIGPDVRSQDVEAWLETLQPHFSAAAWLTISGSLPPGAPPSAYAGLLHAARKTGVKIAVDGYGPWLVEALQTRPDLVKANSKEIGEWWGRPIPDPETAIVAGHALLEQGVSMAVITLGQAGAVAVNHAGAWYGYAPPVGVFSPIGSGDAFLGGLIVALSRGEKLDEALRLAVAVATANAMCPGAGRFRMEDVEELLPLIVVSKRSAKSRQTPTS